MKRVFEDLWQTNTEHPFSGFNTHAYLLQTEDSNVLIYNTSSRSEVDEFDELGGVDYQYLSHRHEASESLNRIKEKYNNRLCISKIEAEHIGTDADIILEEGSELVEGLDVIFTPGHTGGGMCFYYRSPEGHSYLFTGDTYYISNGSLSTLIFPDHGGDSCSMKKSLLKLKALSPDFIISSGSVGTTSIMQVTEREWRSTIDMSLSNL
ncbi:MBL fold metallo-hydrolase [Vibrio profundum]|uniref:MBL fold metallo-hydrolase n=1 Tax=Vibrio profundum TaxID=2910247 RepID=UPI003D13D9BC